MTVTMKKIHIFARSLLTKFYLKSFYRTVLYGAVWLYVTSTAWLNDDLLEILPNVIVKNNIKIKLSECLILSSAATRKIFTDKSFEVYKKTNFSSYKYIFGFLELDKHWRLVFADMDSFKFYYIDPFKALVTVQKEYLATWKSLLAARKEIDHTSIDNWKHVNFKHSKQTDLFNCGIICLFFLDFIFVNFDCNLMCEFDSDKLNNYRISLKSDLDKYEKKSSR
jgi:Ulp1 family protease